MYDLPVSAEVNVHSHPRISSQNFNTTSNTPATLYNNTYKGEQILQEMHHPLHHSNLVEFLEPINSEIEFSSLIPQMPSSSDWTILEGNNKTIPPKLTNQSDWTRGGVTTSKPNNGRYGQSGHPTDMHQGHLPIGGRERGHIRRE